MRAFPSRTLAPLALFLALSACNHPDQQAGGTQTAHQALAGRTPGVDPGLAGGVAFDLSNVATISSRTARAGAPVRATARAAVLSVAGDTVIPPGAVFLGHVTSIHAAPRPGATASLTLTLDSVSIARTTVPIALRVTSLATTMQGRGVTAGDAEKVGAGAAIGGIAGRLIGGNRRGTIIGAATGAAAGAVVAHDTRSTDIVLPAHGTIRVTLARPFNPGTASGTLKAAR